MFLQKDPIPSSAKEAFVVVDFICAHPKVRASKINSDSGRAFAMSLDKLATICIVLLPTKIRGGCVETAGVMLEQIGVVWRTAKFYI